MLGLVLFPCSTADSNQEYANHHQNRAPLRPVTQLSPGSIERRHLGDGNVSLNHLGLRQRRNRVREEVYLIGGDHDEDEDSDEPEEDHAVSDNLHHLSLPQPTAEEWTARRRLRLVVRSSSYRPGFCQMQQ